MSGMVGRLARLPIPAITGAAEATAVLRKPEPLFTKVAEQVIDEFMRIHRQVPACLAVVLGIADCLVDEALQLLGRLLSRLIECCMPVEGHDGPVAGFGLAFVGAILLARGEPEIEHAERPPPPR